MALHCAATLVLLTDAAPPHRSNVVGGAGEVLVQPLAADADVVEELQALADLHRGERVVVPVTSPQRAAVLAHLGRRPRADDGVGAPLCLEVGDDGWALLPAGE